MAKSKNLGLDLIEDGATNAGPNRWTERVRNLFGKIDKLHGGYGLPRVLGWWDASLLTQANGASVPSVPDQGPLGLPLAQYTLAMQPTKQTGPNSLPVMRFTGAQRLRAEGMAQPFPLPIGTAQPVTYIAVMKGTNSLTGYQGLVSSGNTTNRLRLLLQGDNAKGGAYLWSGANGADTTGAVSVRDDAWHIVVGVFDTASASIYVDGQLAAYTATQAHGTEALSAVTVGGVEGASDGYFVGDIGEVLICGDRLSLNQIKNVSDALGAKWGIPVTSAFNDFSYEQTTSTNGQRVRIFTPEETTSSSNVAILWQHPHGANEQLYPNYFNSWLVNAALRKGWTVAASQMHDDSWGNNNATADMLDLYNLLNSRRNITKVVLVGGSMGGVATALALANGSIPNIKGAYFIDAVLSLSALYANPTYTASIQAAYGIAGDGSDYAAKTAGHDPLLLNASAFTAKRLRFSASANDTTVNKANNTDAFRTMIGTTPTEYGLVTHTQNHLSRTGLSASDFVSFVQRCIA